jgi:hypothetical protein
MRTGPRTHNFLFVWTQAQSKQSYSVKQEAYRDGGFHTYLIPLEAHLPWKEKISEVGLVWGGTRESIEIKKMDLRPMRFADRIRYHWSRFWFPEMLNPATSHVIGGPIFMNQAFSWLLTLLFVALVLIHYLPGWLSRLWKKEALTEERPNRPWARFQPVFWGFLALWMIYDLRESYDHAQILKSEFRYYLKTTDYPRHHLELDDFYDFLDFVEKRVPTTQGIGFYSGQPLFVKARYFLLPRRVSERASHLDYIVIFQDPGVAFRDGKLMEGGRVVADGLKMIGGFGMDALLLEKTDG